MVRNMQFAKWLTKQSIVAVGSIGLGLFTQSNVWALTYDIQPGSDVVGENQYTRAAEGEDLGDIGRRYDVGTYEMIEANPGVNFYSPHKADRILVPIRKILPPGPRKGLVINLAEMRIFYYHPDGKQVSSYPIGIGQDGWSTPIGTNKIIRKRKDPSWTPPASIRANYESNGKTLPAVIPAGPTNPLGPYALTTGFENIVIHGTPWPRGVGVRSSHGCIRMKNADVTELYQMVEVNTPVRIIHQAVKVGKNGNDLYLEAHVPVDTMAYQETFSIQQQLQEVMNRHNNDKVSVRWDVVDDLRSKNLGYPEPFGRIN
jgi:L,D-transpeptidase ErfK/SrfK